jgi:hypothetical protein
VTHRATPATAKPVSVAVVRFTRSHGQPQPGIANEISVSGNTDKKPHIGPRTHHAKGHVVVPTQKPISIRAL